MTGVQTCALPISPFLWKKIIRGLSAGRVQSVAVRLVCEREAEIKKFKPDEYWSITALLLKGNKKFEATLSAKNDKPITKLGIKDKRNAETILKDLKNANYIVENIESKLVNKRPFPPFRTSTLQQTAVNKLHYTAKRTMMTAQKLYETGYITYHRTDSLNLSSQSRASAKKFIEKNFSKEYYQIGRAHV